MRCIGLLCCERAKVRFSFRSISNVLTCSVIDHQAMNESADLRYLLPPLRFTILVGCQPYQEVSCSHSRFYVPLELLCILYVLSNA
jgi:hypothetical protein